MNWIPCLEKMPGEGERVLAYAATGGRAVIGCRRKYNDGDGEYRTWECDDGDWTDEEVSHWAKIEKPGVGV